MPKTESVSENAADSNKGFLLYFLFGNLQLHAGLKSDIRTFIITILIEELLRKKTKMFKILIC